MKLKKGKITEDDREDLFEKLQDILRIKENQCQKYLSENGLYKYVRMYSFISLSKNIFLF